MKKLPHFFPLHRFPVRPYTWLLCFLLIKTMANAQTLTFRETAGALEVMWGEKPRLTGGKGMIQHRTQAVPVQKTVRNDVALFSLRPDRITIPGQAFSGVFFRNIPALRHGVTLWRYKPWNSWTKPIALRDATQMKDWDVQFFYWQYDDGIYGAAVPLSGQGFRTTLGSQEEQWGSKALSYVENKSVTEVPAMAIAFGKDPYELCERIYQTALQAMGKGENLRTGKTLPEPLQYLGWCTWNASEMGTKLNEEHIIEGVKTFTDKKFPLGWVLVDDGWFQHRNQQLQALQPVSEKFPRGFRPLINRLKKDYGIKYAGIWHAFNGYWNGIDPDSHLGKRYGNQLFSWKQREKPDSNAAFKTYHFIRPDSDSLPAFFDTWHRYLKGEGFDFVKVDNQLVSERMAVNTYPIFSLSEAIHRALYRSVDQHFKGAIINCMDMTADAYLNFGTSAVARAVEDYFPADRGKTYNLEQGNAAAHVLQAVYNTIYFSQIVIPDYDMFESNHPNAVMHALARTLNNGPIYLTDKPGQQNFDLLKRIVFADGKSIRAHTSLLPTEDCLFQVQEAQLFKTYTRVGSTGLLGLFNAADAEEVKGIFRPGDVVGLQGEQFALYDYFSGRVQLAGRNDSFPVQLERMGYQLHYVVPVRQGFASFGLINKYNAPATITREKWRANQVEIGLYEAGTFRAYAAKAPKKISTPSGTTLKFDWKAQLLTVEIPGNTTKPVLIISW
jgi:hypothetical protein